MTLVLSLIMLIRFTTPMSLSDVFCSELVSVNSVSCIHADDSETIKENIGCDAHTTFVCHTSESVEEEACCCVSSHIPVMPQDAPVQTTVVKDPSYKVSFSLLAAVISLFDESRYESTGKRIAFIPKITSSRQILAFHSVLRI